MISLFKYGLKRFLYCIILNNLRSPVRQRSSLKVFGTLNPGSNPGRAISDLPKANLDYSLGFGQVTPYLVPANAGGIESRTKGLLVTKIIKNKKVLLRDGRAIDLVSSGWLLVCGEGKPFTLPANLEDLPQDKIKDLIKRLSTIRKRKYIRCKERRYGNLNKGFTEGELQQFFKCCKNPRAYLAFKIMALLG